MQRILITGSNRGIGLALVKTYLEQGDVQIFATARTPSNAADLQQLAESNPITILPLDLDDPDSIARLAQTLQAQTNGLDVLFNNAGIFPDEARSRQFGTLEQTAVAQVITTNSVGPLMLTQALVDLLQQGTNPRVLNVSSQMGSIARAGTSGLAYRMSKAAMNMSAKVLANILQTEGITVVTTHPGHVATDMGGMGAPVTPIESAQGLVALANRLSAADSGKFYDYKGAELPW